MKTQRTQKKRTVRWLSTLVLFGVVLLIGFPSGAWAIGTEATTSIDNRAVINYTVGTVPQTLIESSPGGNSTPGATNGADTTFVVDNMVDLSVQTLDAAPVSTNVFPGSTESVIRFQVNNEGNYLQDFLLTAIEQSDGSYTLPFAAPDDTLTDNFNSNSFVRIYVDADGPSATAGYTPSTWDGAGVESQVNYIDELERDESITVYIVIDIPIAQVNGDIAVYGLSAQVAQGGGAGSPGAAINSDDSGTADDAATVQIVFRDGIGIDDPDQVNPDGYHSSRSAFRVETAALEVTKNSTLISDPTGSGTPHHIPGAVVEYEITVDNTGASDANDLVISDQVQANTTFVFNSVSVSNNDGVVPVVEYSTDGGGSWSTTQPADPALVTNIRATNSHVRDADGSATLVFQVEID